MYEPYILVEGLDYVYIAYIYLYLVIQVLAHNEQPNIYIYIQAWILAKQVQIHRTQAISAVGTCTSSSSTAKKPSKAAMH